MASQPATSVPRQDPVAVADRIAVSSLSMAGRDVMSTVWTWLDDRRADTQHGVERIALHKLVGWRRDADTGMICHDSGKFFTIEGLDVHIPEAPVPRWGQPIVNQPEVGILGILVKEFDGVLHCLMQTKFEPGNCNGVQLSPTVQATRSNFTRVHRGKPVPYLDYFRHARRHRVVSDVLQSEQGAWFYRKRNRNMIVEVVEDVEIEPDFHWVTIGQLHRLLEVPNLINMDARTVMSCLPFAANGVPAVLGDLAVTATPFQQALIRSFGHAADSVHTTRDILSWITGVRAQTEVRTAATPLTALRDWHLTDVVITHRTGLFFDVVGVDVSSTSREVGAWTQPMIEPKGKGVVAFLVRAIEGVLHVLVHARVEAGYLDVVEMAPTVQCTPDNLRTLPETAKPAHLDAVLEAPPEQVRFAADLSEEGGRFYHAVNRYLIIEADADVVEGDEFRWVTLSQLADLLRHSHYVNVQARSLVACLHSLTGR